MDYTIDAGYHEYRITIGHRNERIQSLTCQQYFCFSYSEYSMGLLCFRLVGNLPKCFCQVSALCDSGRLRADAFEQLPTRRLITCIPSRTHILAFKTHNARLQSLHTSNGISCEAAMLEVHVDPIALSWRVIGRCLKQSPHMQPQPKRGVNLRRHRYGCQLKQ